MSFPAGFIWGAASASYQVEGASHEDGKKESVWDMHCKRPGAIWKGQNGFEACDHYHRYPEDVAIMQEMGLKAYRLSISWPRVLPDGIGEVNPKGLDFYDRLIDALLAAHIQPYVTLFHWDYPLELYQQGGWLNRQSSDWFGEYARVIASKLGDRVQHWMTLNEPACFTGIGHSEGRHAPGDKLNFPEVLRVTHNALLAHGKAVQAIRAYSKLDSQVGLAHVGGVAIPATDAEEDVQSAQKMMFSVGAKNIWNNTWWLEPIFNGHYPQDGLDLFKDDVPEIGPEDMQTIQQPLDFFGMNNYNGYFVKAGEDGKPEMLDLPVGFAKTGVHWPVTPASLYWGPRRFYERYQKPILITENGLSNTDWVSLDGKVHDPQRIDFTQRYLRELGRAINDGTQVLGYFHWSIMDNFEWAEGYKERFGLVYVDYPTQKRIMKISAYWYKDVIAANGENL